MRRKFSISHIQYVMYSDILEIWIHLFCIKYIKSRQFQKHHVYNCLFRVQVVVCNKFKG